MNNTSHTSINSTLEWVPSDLKMAITYAQSLWFELDFEEWDDFLMRQVFKFYNMNNSKCLIFSRNIGFYTYISVDDQWNFNKCNIHSDSDIHLLNPKEFSYTIDWIILIMNETFTVIQSIMMHKEQHMEYEGQDSSCKMYAIGSEEGRSLFH